MALCQSSNIVSELLDYEICIDKNVCEFKSKRRIYEH